MNTPPAGHGAPRPAPLEALLSDDPALALATADLGARSAAHPCDCHALCVCDADAT